MIVTLERFGQIQTNLDDMLNINDEDIFPWAVNIDDLEAFLLTLAKKTGRIQNLISFLEFREPYHGHLVCGDELEICGLFLKDNIKFRNWGLKEETIVTDADLTRPIEEAYGTGMGFVNERFIKLKKDKHTLFLYNKIYK